jgi:hypothetical protein
MSIRQTQFLKGLDQSGSLQLLDETTMFFTSPNGIPFACFSLIKYDNRGEARAETYKTNISDLKKAIGDGLKRRKVNYEVFE